MFKLAYKLASPRTFVLYTQRLQPYLAFVALACLIYGLIGALWLAPKDYQQGDAFRIIYVHVPAAGMSLLIYALMAFCALLRLVWKIKLAEVIIKASASLGACFTLMALVTGSLWGKPMWGTWWIWDARLTSELILLFLYVGVIVFQQAIDDQQRAGTVVCALVLIGFIDIPIIHYSVAWWNTLHQGATLMVFAKPKMATSMLYPLLSMWLSFLAYFTYVMLSRAQTEVLFRERRTQWVKAFINRMKEPENVTS